MSETEKLTIADLYTPIAVNSELYIHRQSALKIEKRLQAQLTAATERAERAEERDSNSERVSNYKFLVKMMREAGIEHAGGMDLESTGFTLLVAEWKHQHKKLRERVAQLEAERDAALAGNLPEGAALLVLTGETREPQDGEWYRYELDHGRFGFVTPAPNRETKSDPCPIYRHVEAKQPVPADDRPHTKQPDELKCPKCKAWLGNHFVGTIPGVVICVSCRHRWKQPSPAEQPAEVLAESSPKLAETRRRQERDSDGAITLAKVALWDNQTGEVFRDSDNDLGIVDDKGHAIIFSAEGERMLRALLSSAEQPAAERHAVPWMKVRFAKECQPDDLVVAISRYSSRPLLREEADALASITPLDRKQITEAPATNP